MNDPKRENVDIRMALAQWGNAHQRSFPWRNDPSPFESFVATFMLQKTQAAKVLPAFKELTSAFPSFSALMQADLSKIERIFEPLGLTKRAKFLIEASKQICECYRGEVPKDRTDLLSLKGVGDYTANAILCFAFGEPLAIVDGAIARMLRRVFDLPFERDAWEDELVWSVAEDLLDLSDPKAHNYALLDLATTVCTVRNPNHDSCPVEKWCKYAHESVAENNSGP